MPTTDTHLRSLCSKSRDRDALRTARPSRPCANIRTVFREHCPIRKRRDRYQMLRELDPQRSRRIEAIPEFRLPPRRLIDLRMPMAQHDRTVRAHVVDVLVAIDVPDMRAL